MGNLKYKQRHRALGLCTQCSEPALVDSTRCLKHTISHAVNAVRWGAGNREYRHAYNIRYKAKLRAEGRCQTCTAPLQADAGDIDHGFISCFNCRRKLAVPRAKPFGLQPQQQESANEEIDLYPAT